MANPGAPIVTVHVFMQMGCPACDAAKPHLLALRAKYPMRVFVIPKFTGSVHGWSPSGTPGYAVVIGGQLVATHVGTLTLKDLERLIGAEVLKG